MPAQATAELDCRLLPGEDAQQFIATLTKVVSDPQVELSVLLNFSPGRVGGRYAAVSGYQRRGQTPPSPGLGPADHAGRLYRQPLFFVKKA